MLDKYDGATEVKVNRRGRLSMRDPRFSVPTANDLVYLDDSPNYCLPNDTLGSLGSSIFLGNVIFFYQVFFYYLETIGTQDLIVYYLQDIFYEGSILQQVRRADYAIGPRPAWTAAISFAAAGDTTRRSQPSGRDASASFTGVASSSARPA